MSEACAAAVILALVLLLAGLAAGRPGPRARCPGCGASVRRPRAGDMVCPECGRAFGGGEGGI